MRPTFAERFWARVERRGPDECWPWTGTTNGREGRGKVHLGYRGHYSARKRIQAYAYVVAWELTNGPIPEGMKACHRCDNPNCVNPAHIFLGTQADNARDMYAKGRGNSWFKTPEGREYARLSYYDRRALKAAGVIDDIKVA